jgi:hypothetical protein
MARRPGLRALRVLFELPDGFVIEVLREFGHVSFARGVRGGILLRPRILLGGAVLPFAPQGFVIRGQSDGVRLRGAGEVRGRRASGESWGFFASAASHLLG